MKLDKSTKILINLVLILIIAFLVNSFIVTPEYAYAKGRVEYKVLRAPSGAEDIQNLIDKYVEKGWRLHSFVYGASYIFFER